MRTLIYFLNLIFLQSCATQADFSKYQRKLDSTCTLICVDSIPINTIEKFLPTEFSRGENVVFIKPYHNGNWIKIHDFNTFSIENTDFTQDQRVFVSIEDTLVTTLKDIFSFKTQTTRKLKLGTNIPIHFNSSNHSITALKSTNVSEMNKKISLFYVYNDSAKRIRNKKRYPKLYSHGQYMPDNGLQYYIQNSNIFVQYGGLPFLDVFDFNLKRKGRTGCIIPDLQYNTKICKKSTKKPWITCLSDFIRSPDELNYSFYALNSFNCSVVIFSDNSDTYYKGDIGGAHPLYFTPKNELIVLEMYPGFQLKKFVLKKERDR